MLTLTDNHSEPLTPEEENEVLQILNDFIPLYQRSHEPTTPILQRFISQYVRMKEAEAKKTELIVFNENELREPLPAPPKD